MRRPSRKDPGSKNPGSRKDHGPGSVRKCKRKKYSKCFSRVWPRAAQMVKHWPNLGHNDAACGAWGTWRIPMGGLASSKARVTCAKCRRICGLDDGLDRRGEVATAERERRNAKAAEARRKKKANDQAQDIVTWWYVTYGPDDTDQLIAIIAAALLRSET